MTNMRMSNQDAIELLRRIQEPEAWEPQITKGAYIALDMAISALHGQDSETKRICDTCKHDPPSKKWPCVDCDMREPADRWEKQDVPDTNAGKIDRYGYIGIETLLNFCENSKDHAVTPNDFMRIKRVRMPEICEDAVRREDVQSITEKSDWFESSDSFNDFLWALYALPSVTPKRKTGRWKKIGHWGRCYRCDQCGNILDFDGVNAGRGDANFCPNCGAKMEGVNNE